MQSIDIISKVLEILPTINQKYPDINFGGCGTFSYYLVNNYPLFLVNSLNI
jgi:hypothetical protein